MKRAWQSTTFRMEDLEPGSPRPVLRKVVFRSPFSLEPEPFLPRKFLAAGASAAASAPRSAVQAGDCSDVSMRSQDDEKRLAAVRVWTTLSEELRVHSPILSSIPHIAGEALNFLFLNRAATTLNRHARGWCKWSEFARASGANIATPTLAVVLDFCGALSIGAVVDRGGQRVSKAKAALQAMKFVGYKLGIQGLLDVIENAMVEAWLAQDKWAQAAPREAVPLPVSVVAKLEQALTSYDEDDVWVLGAILLMTWGGLRWSDAQRVQF